VKVEPRNRPLVAASIEEIQDLYTSGKISLPESKRLIDELVREELREQDKGKVAQQTRNVELATVAAAIEKTQEEVKRKVLVAPDGSRLPQPIGMTTDEATALLVEELRRAEVGVKVEFVEGEQETKQKRADLVRELWSLLGESLTDRVDVEIIEQVDGAARYEINGAWLPKDLLEDTISAAVYMSSILEQQAKQLADGTARATQYTKDLATERRLRKDVTGDRDRLRVSRDNLQAELDELKAEMARIATGPVLSDQVPGKRIFRMDILSDESK